MNEKCYQSSFKGIDSIVLENDLIKAQWLPSYGSKLASLQTKISHLSHDDNEVLYQSSNALLKTPNYGADFTQYDLSGFDECFPTIEECQSPIHSTTDIKVPDHGEVWTLPWKVESHTSTSIVFTVTSEIFGYKLSKVVKLNKQKIESTYTVTLIGEHDLLPFIWTPHALFKIYQDAKLIIPEHLNEVISVSDNGGDLGDFGTVHPHPYTKTPKSEPIDLYNIESATRNNCEKYYFTDLLQKDDQFGFQDQYRKVMLTVDTKKVPYLGIWKNHNGFNNDYNFALEPCTGIYDNVYKAHKNNTCAVIKKDDVYTWNFSMNIEVL